MRSSRPQASCSALAWGGWAAFSLQGPKHSHSTPCASRSQDLNSLPSRRLLRAAAVNVATAEHREL